MLTDFIPPNNTIVGWSFVSFSTPQFCYAYHVLKLTDSIAQYELEIMATVPEAVVYLISMHTHAHID
jgi:hypothetical protein